MNGCGVPQRLEASGRVITTLEWLRLHRDHGDIEERPAQHPSGKVRCLVCECGAVHVTTEANFEYPQPGYAVVRPLLFLE